MNGFEGKVAVVTGAAQGIGHAIAKRLAKENVRGLAIIDWNEALAQKAADEFNEAFGGTQALSYKCDVSDYEAVFEVFASIENDLGPVDILVNNAGITRDAIFHKMTFEQWDAVVKVNLYSIFNCCRAVINGMRARGYGRIVNLSSTSAYGNPGQANYSATKAGIVGFTKTLARESAGKGIIVNAIAPDLVHTEMMTAVPETLLQAALDRHPMHRMGEPAEVAALAAYLCSSDCSYVSGMVIDCSGADRT